MTSSQKTNPTSSIAVSSLTSDSLPSKVIEVAILIYPQAEVLDYAGPYEVFSTANRILKRLNQSTFFSVQLVAESNAAIETRGGFIATPNASIDQLKQYNLLIVVGGMHLDAQKNPRLIEWIKQQATSAHIVASVCTGAFLLAEAGLLSHKTVTTHWEDIQDLQAQYPQLQVVENQRWVDQEKFVTSAGITAGIDMSLHLVRRLTSGECAELTARQMEFEWRATGQ